MKTLMIDMDDVITSNSFYDNLEKFLGYKFDFSNYDGYRLQDALGDKKSEFLTWMSKIDYYEKATLLPNCYDILKKLNQKYEVYIVTDFFWPDKEMFWHNGEFINYKYLFLCKSFDFMSPRQFMFLANKKLVNFDIKIDDKIDNLDGAKIKILFTAYHNKNVSDNYLNNNKIIRVNNWKEIAQLLLK